MKRSTRWFLGMGGALLLLFGLGCLNYTKPDDLQHHREFARSHDLPAPGNTIVYTGIAAMASGSAVIGYVLGAGRRKAA
jgi:hypothetical protein